MFSLKKHCCISVLFFFFRFGYQNPIIVLFLSSFVITSLREERELIALLVYKLCCTFPLDAEDCCIHYEVHYSSAITTLNCPYYLETCLTVSLLMLIRFN